jgi:menaquinone-dependent protoporphyrinogen oxidase
MSDKILVAYTTAAGSTGQVAEAIGQVLKDRGATVDVRPTKEVKDLSPYRAVVLGTGIRAGKVYGKTLKFLEQHQEALSKLPVAYFVVCMTMADNTEENRGTVETYVEQMRAQAPQVQPLNVGLFAGVMNYKKVPLPLRLIVKAMKVPEGDYRDWDAIRAWAADLTGF